jgi:hypothetical protein
VPSASTPSLESSEYLVIFSTLPPADAVPRGVGTHLRRRSIRGGENQDPIDFQEWLSEVLALNLNGAYEMMVRYFAQPQRAPP